jgi:hypothetical protein
MASQSMDGYMAFFDAIAYMAVSSPCRHVSYVSVAKSLYVLFEPEGAGRDIDSLSSAMFKNSLSNCLCVVIIMSQSTVFT